MWKRLFNNPPISETESSVDDEAVDPDTERQKETRESVAVARAEPGAGRLARALETIAEEVLGQKLRMLEENSADAIEKTRAELSGRLEELGKSQHEAAERAAERVRVRVEASWAEQASALQRKLDELTKNVEALQIELKLQVETSERVSSVLADLGAAFATRAASVARPEPAVAKQAAPEPPAVDTASKHQEVESAIERVFRT